MVSERSRRPELEHSRLGTTDQFPLLRTPADEPGQGGGHRRNATKDRVSPTPQDFIKDPYVLEFLGIPDSHEFREAELEQAIIGKLQTFMLELGKGFAFVSRQQRISTQTKDFFVDLVFYNYLLKCFVLVDLKTGELTHQDIGQMDMYVRLFEDTVKGADDYPTVGIILCAEKDHTVVKYSVLNENRQLFASKYMLYLPTEEVLREELERERALAVREQPAQYRRVVARELQSH